MSQKTFLILKSMLLHHKRLRAILRQVHKLGLSSADLSPRFKIFPDLDFSIQRNLILIFYFLILKHVYLPKYFAILWLCIFYKDFVSNTLELLKHPQPSTSFSSSLDWHLYLAKCAFLTAKQISLSRTYYTVSLITL